jgi:hypothetical protein
MDNHRDPHKGLADQDPPIGAGSLDDSDEQRTSGLPYLPFVPADLDAVERAMALA